MLKVLSQWSPLQAKQLNVSQQCHDFIWATELSPLQNEHPLDEELFLLPLMILFRARLSHRRLAWLQSNLRWTIFKGGDYVVTIKPEQNSLNEKHKFLHELLLVFQCEEGSIADLCCHPVSVSPLTASRLQLQIHRVFALTVPVPFPFLKHWTSLTIIIPY